MVARFDRFFRLRFLRNSAEYIELSDNKVVFNTVLSVVEAPNHANIRIYNLSKATERRIASREFTLVQLIAGYEGNYGTIFLGTLRYSRSGRIDSADTYLDIVASEGDIWYHHFYHSLTIGKGYTVPQMVMEGATKGRVDMPKASEVQGAFSPTPPRPPTTMPPLPDGQAPRGRVLYGPVRESFRRWGQNFGFNWSVQQEELVFIASNAYAPGEIINVNSTTGLIGYPTTEIDGIRFRTLMNHAIFVGAEVRLNNASIIGFLPSAGYTAGPLQEVQTNLQNADGYYKILKAEHHGDTRGQDWYTEVNCVGIGKYVIGASKDNYAVANLGNYSAPNKVNN